MLAAPTLLPSLMVDLVAAGGTVALLPSMVIPLLAHHPEHVVQQRLSRHKLRLIAPRGTLYTGYTGANGAHLAPHNLFAGSQSFGCG
jgi:hypothetical protein